MISEIKAGVLALQGDFERHLHQLSLLNAECREVRRSSDLSGLDGLIIPGGESTTISELIDRFSMRKSLVDFCSGKAVWGTCAGMILLAKEVDDARINPLKIIDISVIRNGYGRQVHSFHREISAHLNGHDSVLQASFIRAPMVAKYGSGVDLLATYQESPILLSQKNCLVSSFHTELDDDLTLTRFFLEWFVIAGRNNAP
jgi:5'-phosphate synthase pdxT subunit